MTIEKMLAQKATMIPKDGFRLVGCDDFEPPGEQLYTISEHATREEAETALAVWKAAHGRGAANEDDAWVYGPDDQ